MDKPKITRNMTVNQIAKIHRQWVKDSGADNAEGSTLIEKAALASTEFRRDKLGRRSFDLGRKLANVILMVMDLAEQKQIDIDHEIVSKMISNSASGNVKNRSK